MILHVILFFSTTVATSSGLDTEQIEAIKAQKRLLFREREGVMETITLLKETAAANKKLHKAMNKIRQSNLEIMTPSQKAKFMLCNLLISNDDAALPPFCASLLEKSRPQIEDPQTTRPPQQNVDVNSRMQHATLLCPGDI